MKILFLYTEVAAYFLACAETLHTLYGCEVHIVRWPVNEEAPFRFREYQGVRFYERREMGEKEMLDLFHEISPDLVYVTGWMDKGYLKVAGKIKGEGVPVVCALDNHWRGDLRQRIATLISPLMLKKRFTHTFVPGRFQYEFARRLGFSPDRILTGMYSADVTPFHEAFSRFSEDKKTNWPHNFLYVGRIIDVKGIKELCQAFLQLKEELSHDWTLTLVGKGNAANDWLNQEGMIHLDFVQPENLPDLVETAGCFVLPSRNEPWGVVLHEFAAAGLPLIAAENVGAASAFLKTGYNGYTHQPGSVFSIKEAMRNIIHVPDEKLLVMGERSYELSRQITPEIWASTLFMTAKTFTKN
ncbi:MAG: glycosyltransferase family 4 protein [Bacteroidetes bacterium]|nr:glycosyltransferase family 4 protein [Bacteroidota bacterium]